MNIKKELGEKIKKHRKVKGLTQEQLAELVDISPRNLSNIELGLSFVKSDTLEKILNSLNITMEELFENSELKTNQEFIIAINNLVDKVKNNNKVLAKIYKILKFVIND